MKIAIDVTFTLSGGASTFHLRELLKQLASIDSRHEYLILLTPYNEERIKKIGKSNFHFASFKTPGTSHWARILWLQIYLPFYLHRKKVDLLFCPGNICTFFSSFKKVLMIQTIGPFCRDVYSIGRNLIMRTIMYLSVRRADKIIFITNFLRDEFSKKFRIDTDKCVVIPFGADHLDDAISKSASPSLLKRKIKNNFILCAGHLYRYKNIPKLLEAFAKSNMNQTCDLLIAGKIMDQHYFQKRISPLIESYQLQDNVKFPGEVEHERLGSLYKDSLFFIFPSTCESFGKVLLEAMSFGTPILCSNLTAMPEICKDAAIYFDPYDVNDMSQKMLLLAENKNLRKDSSYKALKRVREFPTWEEVTRRTLDVLEKIGGMKSQ